MSCGLPSCSRRAKEFGVCGTHKNFAYQMDDQNFWADMEPIMEMLETFHQQDRVLESQGKSLLDIQKYWGNNLCGKRQEPLPDEFKTAGDIMERIAPSLLQLQTKWNPNLVYITFVRKNHALAGPCVCTYCSLGQ